MDEKGWRLSTIFWSLVLGFGALTFFYNVVEVKTFADTANLILLHERLLPVEETSFIEDAEIKGYAIKTPGCTIPDLKVLDPLIKKFIFQERPVVCQKGVPPLFDSNRTSVFLLQDSLIDYKISDEKLLKCCYSYFKRKQPKKGQNDKEVVYSQNCTTFVNSFDVAANEEFVRVTCDLNHTRLYKDFFSFVPLKENPVLKEIDKSSLDNKLNVVVVGIDAVSRLNFHRQMPKTVFYLKKLQAVELLGYTKVGDNTFPNLMVALSGHSENELRKICWPTDKSHFDKCDFIFNKFKRAGFTTAFGEDAAWMGLFNYQRRGFRNQPTDYYYGHFDVTATNEIGNNHRLNVVQCLGSRQTHRVFLQYIETFVRTMHESAKRFFGFFWSTALTHDLLNKPKLGDQEFMDLLFSMDQEGVLNNTVLFLMSDHGIRWGDIRSTYQGRMEERLPFLYVVLPEWFKAQNPEYYNNLRRNRRRLTTPYDLHATFLHLLNQTSPTNSTLGYSLFEEIPKNRTCLSAGIEMHWCACQSSVNIDISNPDVVKSVNYTVNYINNLLTGYGDCVHLKLDRITSAQELLAPNVIESAKKSSRDFSVTFITQPGGAIFESTVRKELTKSTNQYSVTGTVSRLNLYGSQSKCISDFHLKLYCYCQSYLGN